MPNLSPQAQAVFQACSEASWDWSSMTEAHFSVIAAATVRPAAEEIAPIEMKLVDEHLYYEKDNPVRNQLLSLANEIENHV